MKKVTEGFTGRVDTAAAWATARVAPTPGFSTKLSRQLAISLVICGLLILLSACQPDQATPTPTDAPAETVEITETPDLGDPPEMIVEQMTLESAPILPTVSEHALDIYREALAQGRNPQVFSKVGDCMTASPNFLTPLGTGGYDLGNYADLQETVDTFGAVTVREIEGNPVNSFSNPGLAAASGCTTAGPLDQTWANPTFCEAGEIPLACEYRLSNPAIALIMFGTNDVYYFDAEKYESYLRNIIEETLAQNVLPVLSTFPTRLDRAEESIDYNRIVVRLAAEYDIPLINLWLALSDLPDDGVNTEDVTHLTVPGDGCLACFDDAHLQYGITVHNLTTLTALDALRKALIAPGG
ncbi:MAG: SGNH/GDSL hydrolase family protein [Anaerolineae bacterium]|nr:SGNH/GDSL hydrolase family protein [Anaerolineae bacterium]